jgi:hypothetical protein
MDAAHIEIQPNDVLWQRGGTLCALWFSAVVYREF